MKGQGREVSAPKGITPRGLLAYYIAAGEALDLGLPPAVIKFARVRGGYADMTPLWCREGVSRRRFMARVTIRIDPRFRGDRRLALRELYHEIGHVLSMRWSDKRQDEHGPRFQRAMRMLVKVGLFDENLW